MTATYDESGCTTFHGVRTLLSRTSFTQPATVGGGQTVTHILNFAPTRPSR